MALAFNFGDLPELAALAAVHPDPERFWAWVSNHTTNADLIEVASEFSDAWVDAGTTPLLEASRVADAVQELQAIEQRIELVRTTDNGDGRTVEAQLAYTVASV